MIISDVIFLLRLLFLLKMPCNSSTGTLQGNHEILRDIKSLVHRLPLMDNPKFQSDYAVQCNDVTLITYLGSITKGCNTVNQFVSKFNTLYDRQGMGRRMRGLFY